MILFARFAYYTLLRDTVIVSGVAILTMLAFSFSVPLAIDAGATVLLLFALGLLLRVVFWTERHFAQSEAWNALEDDERPAGEDGLLWARAELEKMTLRFAKNAAGAAGVLYTSALAVSLS